MKSGYTKIGGFKPTKPVIQKLRIMDYVFCYKGIDLNNASIDYYFDKIQYVEFEYDNGEKINENESFSPIINFSISAEDKNKKVYSFDFMVNINVDMLNEMPNKPTNINELVIEGEVFFTDPYVGKIEQLDIYNEEYIYQFTPSFWVQKIANKKFVFKIQFQDFFIWFHIDFN